MANWTKPVDNRTEYDNVINSDRAYTNYTDLNRIEENIQYLSDIFNLNLTTKYNWALGDFTRFADRDRILNNVESLREYCIQTFATSNANWYYPLPVSNLNTWQHWNAIENMILRCYRAWRERDIPDFEIIMPELIIDEEIGVL